MAIIIRGKSKCTLCGKFLEEGQEVVAFSPFVGNELDPLWVFSDAGFHADCFHQHPLSGEAKARYENSLKRTGPHNRVCVVCKREIKDPDDYFTLGYLVSDRFHPLFPYNYTQAHCSCLPKWPECFHLYELIKDLAQSGDWRGNGLEQILTLLHRTVNQ